MKLGDDEVTLSLPSSIEERIELFQAAILHDEDPNQRARVKAAALALCWPLLRQAIAARGVRFNGDVLDYGRVAIDVLLSQDHAPQRSEVLTTGMEAMKLVEHAVKAYLEAAKKPEDFSGTSGRSGASSSQSSGSGTSHPVGSAPSNPSSQPSSSRTSA